MSHSNPHEIHNAADGSAEFQHRSCGTGELRDLLNTLSSQLADVDRRQSETLTEMQDRLVGIGREAQSLRERVPDHFGAVIDRIEMRMNELSERFSANHSSDRLEFDTPIDLTGQVSDPEVSSPLPAIGIDMPMALRSALAANLNGSASHEAARAPGGIDPFEIIESSGHQTASDLWDGASAEALTQHYESGAAYVPEAEIESETFIDEGMPIQPQLNSTPQSVDAAWLESRLAEIAGHLEQSIADVRPDDGFYAIGQRLDQFEQNFASIVAEAGANADAEAIRQIESHIEEVAKHLEHTQDQLMRLSVIENQLALVTSRLDEVYEIATRDESGQANWQQEPAFDISEMVRTTAEETAKHFSSLPGASAGSGVESMLRPMIDELIAQQRQSDENTNAMLDTLQHAMVGLLDRIEAMEFGQPAAPVPAYNPKPKLDFPEYDDVAMDDPSMDDGAMDHRATSDHPMSDVAMVAEEPDDYAPSFGNRPLPTYPPALPTDYAAAAMAPAEAATAGLAGAEPARGIGKDKVDLVAEARRARMRLADYDSSAAEAPYVPAGSATADGIAVEPVRKLAGRAEAAGPQKAAGPSGPSPRLMILAAILAGALGGYWYFNDKPTPMPVAEVPAAATVKPGAAAPAATKGSAFDQQVPNELPGQRGELNTNDGTEGEIIPGNLTVGEATVPMLGITVHTDGDVTAEQLNKQRRHQAMADISTKLGAVAAQTANQLVQPAALIPETPVERRQEPTAEDKIQNSILSRSGPLDMPPATVGPLSLRLAAANGDPSAEFEVGARLAEGKGTTKNFSDAAKWYQRAASKGLPQAQYRLGTLYERGLGLETDVARATSWYTSAAEQGNIKAMHNLAVLSANQKTGSPDYVTAAHWFREAADRGLADSQFNLAVLYENGLGVEQDLKQAFVWISLATKSGDTDAIRRRDILRGKLSAKDLADAERALQAWRPKPLNSAANDARAAGEAWKKNAG